MRIVDGNNLMHRVADAGVGSAVHPVREVYNRFVYPPEVTIIVWDGPSANKRRQDIFPDYKTNRPPKEESKYKFFEIAKGVLTFTPVIQVEIRGWEADDIIGTMINRWHTQHQITVETNDGDYWQHKDKCYLPLVTKRWHHMSAEECLLYKALVGEAKDNVKGLKGFGDKSWEYFTDQDKRNAIDGILENDYQKFAAANWPHRVKMCIERLREAQLYWRLNSWWQVPEAEIDENMKQGKSNPAAAEYFLEQYLI